MYYVHNVTIYVLRSIRRFGSTNSSPLFSFVRIHRNEKNENYFQPRIRLGSHACRDFYGQCPSFHFYSCPCPVPSVLLLLFFPVPSILRFSLARAHFCLCVCACFLFTLAVSRLALRAHKTQCGTDVKYYKWETVCRASRRNYSEEQITRKRCGNLFKRHQQGIHHVIQTV